MMTPISAITSVGVGPFAGYFARSTKLGISVKQIASFWHMTQTLPFRVIYERNAPVSMEMSFFGCAPGPDLTHTA